AHAARSPRGRQSRDPQPEDGSDGGRRDLLHHPRSEPDAAVAHASRSTTPVKRECAMGEEEIKGAITQMGTLSRREFSDRMVAFGVSAPVAARWLAEAGIARAETSEPPFTPMRRGGGGAVKVLMPSAPTLLNPWLALGWKDLSASR